MKLWLIKTYNDVSYDEYDSFVVRAENKTEARSLANKKTDSMQMQRFNNDTYASCIELTNSGAAGVVIGSFNAG